MQYSEQYKRFLNSLGYFNYQQGLIYRHLGQKEGWQSHLYNCRNYILKAIDLLKPEKVSVLGSGWLLDLPLAEITERNIHITLYDIVHPPDVAKQVSTLRNIEIVEADLTGGLIREIWKKTGSIPIFRRLKTLDEIKIPRFRFSDDPGLVVSLNILSQLDVLPVKYLRKKSNVSEKEFLSFRSEIQRKHLELLAKHNSVLITDIEEIFYDRSGSASAENTVITDIPEGNYKEEWIWDFDLKRSDYYQKRSVLKVIAIIPGK